MKQNYLIALVWALLLLGGCSKNYYISNNFEQRTQNHKVIAILPAQMIYTNNLLDDLGLENQDLAEIEEAESRAFQISLSDQLLAMAQRGKKSMRVELQSLEQTNHLLASKNINIKSSWDKSPSELAAILGVDAVVKSRVEKQRYLPDLAAFGISLGTKIVSLLTRNPFWLINNGNVAKTNDLYISCSLIDGENNNVLWSTNANSSTDWNVSLREVADRLNNVFARKFPYK